MGKIIVKDFFLFIKRPNDIQLNISFKEKITFVLYLLGFELIFNFLVIFPIMEVINKFEKIKYPKIQYFETFSFILISFVLLIPFLEELIFRYFLRYKGLKAKIINEKTWDKIFPTLVYLFSFSFGFIHISNYTNESIYFILFSPLIILSQLFGGFIITFIRVRLNFKWGVFYHCFWNFIFILLFPITFFKFSNSYEETTEDYKIKITESYLFDKNKQQVIRVC